MNTLLFTAVFVISAGAPCRASHHITMTPTDQAWVQQLNDQREQESTRYRDEALQIIDDVNSAPAACRVSDRGHSEHQNESTSSTAPVDQAHEDRYPRLLVFVSSTMSMATLRQLGTSLQRQGGKLVFRGLINNSFKEMAAFLQELGHEALIDPTLFAALNIQTVPTFVLFEKAPQVLDELPAYDRLQGNVSLTYALEKFGGKDNAETLQQAFIKVKVKP